MDDPLDAFLQRCTRVLAGDTLLIGELQRQGFACTIGHWQFRLPALHALLCHDAPNAQALDYAAFRQRLLKGPVNRSLRAHGGQILILDNRGKVDLSLYALGPVDPD
ncbi:MAG: hypothetical protein V4812_19970 [Pseudomonadota bacterium]